MKKMKIAIAYFVILSFVAVISVTKAEAFDPEAISQVSKGIAEWKLMNQDKSETQLEQKVYVSSSLSGMVERGSGKGVVQGLAAFNNNHEISSQTRQWELDAGLEMSNKYIQQLAKPPYPSIITSMSNRTAIYGIGQNVVREYGQRGAQIFSSGTAIIGSTSQAAGTFLKTTDYVGTSMQVINPPIYLREKTPYGWKGEGLYSIKSNGINYQVGYHETLKTAGHGPITRSHTDYINSDIGTYYRHTEIKTPVINNFERFALNRHPLGSYWDSTTSTSSTVTRIQQSYHVETIRGVSKITPLPNSKIGTLNYGNLGNRLYIPRATWYMPKTTISVPQTRYSIPKTSYSVPRIK